MGGLNSRTVLLGLFLLCAGMLGVGYFMQYSMHLEPCPLCITQRIFIFAVGISALAGALHNPGPTGIRAWAGLALLLACIGGSFSTRHLWLQSLPADQVPACGPSFDYILETFPLRDALRVLLRGTGDCAKVDWSFLGVSIPGWTLLAFAMMAGVCLWTLWRPRRAGG